jgi:ketose-bisphosphate aldolase
MSNALTSYADILGYAKEHKIVAPGLNVFNMETAQAVIRAANDTNVPIIVQIFRDDLKHTNGPSMIHSIVETAAKAASVNVALGLDHGSSIEQAIYCIDNGFTGVMIDLSDKGYDQNVRDTREVIRYAHERGVSVEAEIGIMKLGSDDPESVKDGLTDPDTARRFLADTKVDCLAVAIGTAHGQYHFEPEINFELLEELIETIPCPIVIHGGSGTSDEDILRMVKMGVSKINIGTEMFDGFRNAILRLIEEGRAETMRPLVFMDEARKAVYDIAVEKLKLLTAYRI